MGNMAVCVNDKIGRIFLKVGRKIISRIFGKKSCAVGRWRRIHYIIMKKSSWDEWCKIGAFLQFGRFLKVF